MEEHFRVSSKLILNIGRNSIKDHTTALLELVKNCYDADSRHVNLDIMFNAFEPHIVVTDDGCGMSLLDLRDNWLNIGYSEKQGNKYSISGRRKTGEKGIGRMSADRLGASLTLKTHKHDEEPVGLKINWDAFDTDAKNIEEISISPIQNSEAIFTKIGDSKTGTQLYISKLRQRWSNSDITELIREISIFSPPFSDVNDFQVTLTNDVNPNLNGVINSPALEISEIDMTASYHNGMVKYSFLDRIGKSEHKTNEEAIEWDTLIQRVNSEDLYFEEHKNLGDVSLRLLFYTRDIQSVFDSKLRLSDLRDFLNVNSGIKIYRDNVLVKPYGTQKAEGDWLGLAERKTRDPAGISRPSWKVSANQLVGAVFIGRDTNPQLVDTGGREGLLNNEVFYTLKAFVLGALILLETHRHERMLEEKSTNSRDTQDPKKAVEDLSSGLTILKSDLSKVRKEMPKSRSKQVERALDQVNVVEKDIKKAKKMIDELMDREQVLRGLATIGISAAVFGHEVQQPISEVKAAIVATRSALNMDPPKCLVAQSEIEKAFSSAARIASWGVFALNRVQRDNRRKSKIEVSSKIEQIIDQTKAFFDISSIIVTTELARIETKAFAMDLESIVLNLLSNSYSACTSKRMPRKVHVVLKKEDRLKPGFVIQVSDSGPGVAEKFKNNIWDALFTTKVDNEGNKSGTGLGLFIIQTIVTEYDGDKFVDRDEMLGGAKFTIWLPIK